MFILFLIHEQNRLQRSHSLFLVCVLYQTEICPRQLVVTAVSFHRQSGVGGLDAGLSLSLFDNHLVKQTAAHSGGSSGKEDIVLGHRAAHRLDALPRLPGHLSSPSNVKVKHSVEAIPVVLLPQEIGRAAGKFHMVDVAHHNVEVGILGVVEVVDLPALDKQGILGIGFSLAFPRLDGLSVRGDPLILAELGDVPRLDIHHLGGRPKGLLQQLGHNFTGLPGLHQLAGNEAGQLLRVKSGGTCQPLILFLADQSLPLEHGPKGPHMLPYLTADGIGISLLAVELPAHQHPVFQAVILGLALGVDVVDVIARVQLRNGDHIPAVHTPSHLDVVQIQLVPA